VGIRDIVTFHGEAVDELEAAFNEAVDHYLATCAKLGDKPNKPYSGKLTLRISPRVHAAVATAAETSGKSLNKWVADVLDQVIQTQ
jgi:predicted HicB family RNase H-like nuclease